jgi:hypothetical protein
MLRTILLMTRGIILDPRVRRWAMFVLLLVALVMVFAGSTFLAGSLGMPWGFLLYWGVCAWLTFAALMLALWDILMVRTAARKARRELEKQISARKTDEEP